MTTSVTIKGFLACQNQPHSAGDRRACRLKKWMLLLLAVILWSGTAHSQILKQPIPDKLVVLTFDDAPASHYSVVAPLLQEHGFGATFFVCEFPPNFADTTKYMNWRQMQALHRMGFEVANHTHTHAHVNELTKQQTHGELEYIEEKCAAMDIPLPKSFAYPAYAISETCFELLEEKAYEFARAGGKRAYDPLSDHPFLIPSWATTSENEEEIMAALGEAKDGKIVVLTIHGVPDIEHPWVNTPISLFEKYLEYLKENHFQVVSLRDLKQYIDPMAAKKVLPIDTNKPYKN
ncbi:polysaccharide deacetylase family protein [Echinicola vietnamensis]|uniref:Putative xylanase/chitin deacetylase n=1 Tax=Echinicola vietnamensis (strain DSM 17526 / LMG 23754 / KMM 6221) TaxID=926556 RepID=L0FYR8_ECHVK|nr:polysaccharide deacetylase family protein [Echinicola vietnamensis]AGA77906.1 putative xylanase/chitin deacetylase [Echinicola vietnamensis DSM 17526]